MLFTCNKRIGFRVKERQYEAFKKGAEMLELSMKQLCTRAVEEYLLRHLSESQIDDIFQDTLWAITKK